MAEDPNDRLAEARRALVGDRATKAVSRESREGIDSERLRVAGLAMEGEERRRKREMREKFIREKEDTRKKIGEDIKRRQVEENRQKILAAEAERYKTEKEEHVKAEKTLHHKESTKIIEQLKQEANSSLNPLRTWHGDTEKYIAENNLSAVAIAVSEQSRSLTSQTGRTKVPVSSAPSSPWLRLFGYLLVILLLLAAGGGIFYYLRIWRPGNPILEPPVTPSIVNSIIFADRHLGIEITGTSSDNIGPEIKTAERRAVTGGLTDVYFRFGTSTGEAMRFATFDEFNRSARLNWPIYLSRFIDQSFMFGFYFDASEATSSPPAPFLVLKIKSYDQVYASLLYHENDLVKNTFTSLSGEGPDTNLVGQTFTDETLQNVDVRLIKNAIGQTKLVYGFIDPKGVLLLTTNENAFLKLYNAYINPKPKTYNCQPPDFC